MERSIDLGIEDLEDFKIIGSGGFATVYSARDKAFNRSVAIKVLTETEGEVNRSFERERTFMGQLSSHPNVITPYRHGFTKDGALYLVMEHMGGGSLLDLIKERGSIDVVDAIDIVLPIADALSHSHAQGILHKDVKPANILISDTGIPKLSDFGISTIREKTATQISFTMAHTPPETFADGYDNRDERADYYSLASALYSAVTGGDAFEIEGQDSQFAYMRRIELHEVPPTGLDYLDQFFSKAMAKDPADRFATASEFAAGLRTLRDTAANSANPAVPSGTPPSGSPATATAPPLTGLPPTDPAVKPAGNPARAAGPAGASQTDPAPTNPTLPMAPPPAVASPALQAPLPLTGPAANGHPSDTSQLAYQETMTAMPGAGQPSGAPSAGVDRDRQARFNPSEDNQNKRRKPALLALCGVGALAAVGVGFVTFRPDNDPISSQGVEATEVEDDQIYTSIRDVDFRNGSYFETPDLGLVTVEEGAFDDASSGAGLRVLGVSYGDLNADGPEEAAVRTVTYDSNAEESVEVDLYRLSSDGAVEQIETDSVLTNGNGQVLDGWIAEDLLQVEFADLSDSGASIAARNKFRLSEVGLELIEGEQRALSELGTNPTTVEFLPNTSSAVLAADQSGAAVLDIGGGQAITVEGIGGQLSTNEILIKAEGSGETLARGVGKITTGIWEDGNYTIEVVVEPQADGVPIGPTLFLVEVEGARTPQQSPTSTASTEPSSTTTTADTTTSTSEPTTSTTTEELDPTVVAGGDSLKGRHALTLQWVLFTNENPGSIEFTPTGNETYDVFGTHSDNELGTSVAVAGTITKVSELELQFSGSVTVTDPASNGGAPCQRTGNMTFLSTKGRQYWRMQNYESPCDVQTDYVDIYFN